MPLIDKDLFFYIEVQKFKVSAADTTSWPLMILKLLFCLLMCTSLLVRKGYLGAVQPKEKEKNVMVDPKIAYNKHSYLEI